MFHIPTNKMSKNLLQKQPSAGVTLKKILLKISQNSQEDTCKIDLKRNFKINLTIGTSTVVVSCKCFEICKSTYFLEHLQATLEIVGKDLKDLSREKCAYSELFWSVFSRIRTKCREIMETGIIANTDTFRAVIFALRIVENLMI